MAGDGQAQIKAPVRKGCVFFRAGMQKAGYRFSCFDHEARGTGIDFDDDAVLHTKCGVDHQVQQPHCIG